MPNNFINTPATGIHLKTLAQKYGYTRAFLADAFGVTPNAITHYYSGKHLSPVDKLHILSNLFMLPIEELLILKEPDSFLYTYCPSYTLQSLGTIYDDLNPHIQKDITKRIMDALLSGYPSNSHYIQNQINFAFRSLEFNRMNTNQPTSTDNLL